MQGRETMNIYNSACKSAFQENMSGSHTANGHEKFNRTRAEKLPK